MVGTFPTAYVLQFTYEYRGSLNYFTVKVFREPTTTYHSFLPGKKSVKGPI
jgi:hypothetical protein